MRRIERRTVSDAELETRSGDDGQIHLRGYAAVFDSESRGEVVTSTAFTRTLTHDHDVRLLVNHDGVPLARTRSGTLSLSTDERGLIAEATLDAANPTVAELHSAMSRGDIDQMSFAFRAVDEQVVDGIRELREVELWDVSVVTYPWYEDTSAELYSAVDRLVEARGAAAAAEILDEASQRTEEQHVPHEDDEVKDDLPAVRLVAARALFPTR